MSDPLQVCETFVSIQGESTFAGCSCFFIRLAGCNLRCSYCDTKKAYTLGRPRPVAQLVRDYLATELALVEVTGGEPLIQAETPELLRALKAARPDALVLVETNGSCDISVIPPGVVAVMDIKCPGSGAGESFDWNNIGRLRPQDEVKFVVSDRADFDWAANVINRHGLASKCRAVLVSPVSNKVAAAELAAWLIEARLPARLNLQLHKLAGFR